MRKNCNEFENIFLDVEGNVNFLDSQWENTEAAPTPDKNWYKTVSATNDNNSFTLKLNNNQFSEDCSLDDFYKLQYANSTDYSTFINDYFNFKVANDFVLENYGTK